MLSRGSLDCEMCVPHYAPSDPNFIVKLAFDAVTDCWACAHCMECMSCPSTFWLAAALLLTAQCRLFRFFFS